MPFVYADAVRNVGELVCDCDYQTVVQMHEDGDRQEDGSILWSGCAMGECPKCGQAYADWWEGTFKISDGLSRQDRSTEPDPNVAD